MSTAADSPLACFLVRAWREPGGLRARVRYSLDHTRPGAEFLIADPDDLLRCLSQWLHDLDRPTGAPPTGPR